MEEFISPEGMREILGDLMDELPEEFFQELNLGVILEEGLKEHELSRPEKPLYILGQYVRNALGRQIVIFYGSFRHLFRHLSQEDLKNQLRETLRHEFRHHIEYLAGVKDLEIMDWEKLQKLYFGKM